MKNVVPSQPEAAPEGLIRNAALQEAAAHLRDLGYWTQGAAVLSLCTDASTPAPASAQDDLVKALAFLFDARLKATERLQQFLDTFGDLGDRNTDAEMSDWLGYKSPASTDFTDLEKFIRKQLSATGGAK